MIGLLLAASLAQNPREVHPFALGVELLGKPGLLGITSEYDFDPSAGIGFTLGFTPAIRSRHGEALSLTYSPHVSVNLGRVHALHLEAGVWWAPGLQTAEPFVGVGYRLQLIAGFLLQLEAMALYDPQSSGQAAIWGWAGLMLGWAF